MTMDRDVPVCIDGRLLNDGGAGTGVAQYARTLVSALRLAGRPPMILDDGGSQARRSDHGKRMVALRLWPRKAVANGEGYWARDIFREAHVFFSLYKKPMPLDLPGQPGVMHWTYPLPMRIRGWRNIYTVHDVMPLDPSVPTPVNGLRLRTILDMLRADGGDFVTVSEAAHAQITAAMGWPKDEVIPCHQGVDVAGVEQGTLPSGLKSGGYLLYIGAVEARKNLTGLLEAYRSSGLRTPLVISGPDGLDVAYIDALIQATPGAMRLGLQARDTVLQLIANARALTLVSLAEGFGVPVVEAMALGTPVLSSNVPALAEIGAGATLQVDPLDPAQLRDGLITIDSHLSLRDELIARGLQRSRYFELEPYAQRLLKLYGMA